MFSVIDRALFWNISLIANLSHLNGLHFVKVSWRKKKNHSYRTGLRENLLESRCKQGRVQDTELLSQP